LFLPVIQDIILNSVQDYSLPLMSEEERWKNLQIRDNTSPARSREMSLMNAEILESVS